MIGLNSTKTTTFQEWFGLINAVSGLMIPIHMIGLEKAKINIYLKKSILKKIMYGVQLVNLGKFQYIYLIEI